MTAQLEGSISLDRLISFKDLEIGSTNSPVGICTLWTQRHLISSRLDKADFFICANLYSFAGISLMARNIFMFPQIRYLILCGADQSNTGEALATLFEHGPGPNLSIPGTQAKLDEGIPLEAWKLFFNQIELIDLRPIKGGPKNPEELAKRIKEEIARLEALPPFTTPQIFPEVVPEGGKPLPGERTGFRVQGETVAETWLEMLHTVMRFGQLKPTEYSQKQREIYNTVAVITGENPDDLAWADYLPFSRAELEAYYPRMLSGEKEPGVAYTYGERLRRYGPENLDQIERMKMRLKEAHHTRRAVAITWDAGVDGVGDNPPCLLEVSAGVQDGQLYMTARFRSHDIYTAWPQNTYALRMLQKEVADDTGLALGPLTIISHSAHIYADKWKFALDTVDSFRKKKLEWRSDPRGYFVISVDHEKGLITVQHSTIEGNTPFSFEGKSARQLGLEVALEKLILHEEHHIYLGRELQKAEIALKLGLEYRQDKELDFSNLTGS